MSRNAALIGVLFLLGAVGFTQGQATKAGAPPGEEQRKLEQFIGSYIATVRIWDDPNGDPVETKHFSEQRMVMGGRFLEVVERSEDSDFQWRAVHGFDTGKKHYVSVGISNQSNEISIADSHIDNDGNWLLLGPAGQEPTFKGVGTLTADGYTYVNYRFGPNREEIRYREIIYRRR